MVVVWGEAWIPPTAEVKDNEDEEEEEEGDSKVGGLWRDAIPGGGGMMGSTKETEAVDGRGVGEGSGEDCVAGGGGGGGGSSWAWTEGTTSEEGL